MRVCVVGAGGLGTVLAAYLARAGVEVTLLVKPVQAAAFLAAEVSVEGLAQFTAPVHLAVPGDRPAPFDYVVLTVKGRDTAAALAALRGWDMGAVLSLQNGVAKDEQLVAACGRARVLGALTSVGGQVLRPGRARHTLLGPTLVGELDGTVSPRCAEFTALCRGAGLPAEAVADIVTREWHKLAVFLRTAPVCALARTDIAGALLSPHLLPLCLAVAREVAAVAGAEGHSLGALPVWHGVAARFSDPDGAVMADLQRVATGMQAQGMSVVPSLAQDVAAGRPTELEETAGDVLRRAERLGLGVPHLATLVRLLRALTGTA